MSLPAEDVASFSDAEVAELNEITACHLRTIERAAKARRGLLSDDEKVPSLEELTLARCGISINKSLHDQYDARIHVPSNITTDPYLYLCDRCESPPEHEMLQAMIDVGRGHMVGEELHLTSPDGTDCICSPQHAVGRRRIDFAIFGDGIDIAVEVDGYAYHYATTEQADETLLRTRELLGFGWRVVPFSARQVIADARGCALEALSLVRWFP